MEKKNKKKVQVNPETTILSVAEIEGILNKETLKNLPNLVDEMDENLAININNFLSNVVFKGIKLDKQNVIDVVKQSKKLHYDNKSQLIRFKEKADRNIIIFRNVIEIDEDVNPKCEYIKNAIGNKSKCLIGKLKGVDRVEKNLFFIFDNEDHTQEIEKIMNLSLKNQEKDFENLDFTLAAETLKRRISPLMNYDIKLEDQIEIISTILINPTPFIRRRFTVGNKAKSPCKNLSITNNTNILNQDKSHVFIGNTDNHSFKLPNQQNKITSYSNHPFDPNFQPKSNFNNNYNNNNVNPSNKDNRVYTQNQINFNNYPNKAFNNSSNLNNGFNLSSINATSQYFFPNQNLTMNNSYLNPNNNLNLNHSFSFTSSYAYMKGYLTALSNLGVLNQNLYNSLLLDQQKIQHNSNNPTSQKSKSPNKKRTSQNKFDAVNNNQKRVLNISNNNTNTNILNTIQSFKSMNNDLNLKSIEANIGRRSPSLKKLDITNAEYYANLINSKNLNNTSMINNPNNSTLANISLNETDMNKSTLIDKSVTDRLILKKTDNPSLSVVKEKNEDENGNQGHNNKVVIDSDNDNNDISTKELEKNKKEFLQSNRNSIAINFANFNPANFYNQNVNNISKSNNNNNYFYGENYTPVNPKINAGRHGSMTSLNLNFSNSNKKASIFSNDCYLRNSIIQSSFINNPVNDNINKNNNDINTNNQQNTSCLDPKINNNIGTENSVDGRVKSKTIYKKKKNFNNINNIQRSNFTASNTNENNTTNIPNNSETPKKQGLRFESRQSKLSTFNENLLSSSKKMSFLSNGEEVNLISEFNKNMKLIPERSRKSSLNFLSLLKSQDLSKNRNSTFSIDFDLGILKDYENNAEKSANIEFQYETNDIISVYFHMNYLKLFTFPEEFRDSNYIEGIMAKEVKGNIEKLKEKKLIIKNKANCVLHKLVNLKARHNSISKVRLSQNVNSYQLMSLVEETLDEKKNKRKRHCSLKN